MRSRVLFFVSLMACAVSTDAAIEQKGKPPKPALTTLGTAQMPGAACELGKGYSLGKISPLNVCLVSVEYRIQRIATYEVNSAWPEAGKKLMVLHFTIQNPLAREQQFDRAIKWTAVTADDENIETAHAYFEPRPGKPSSYGKGVLKPGQKVAVFSVLTVPSAGEIPKVIAANAAESNALVARYDVRKKGKGIAAPYGDGSATPLETVNGALGTLYEVGNFDVTVYKLEVGPRLIDEIEHFPVNEGEAYVLVTYSAANRNWEGLQCNSFGGTWLGATIQDAEGIKYTACNANFRTSSLVPSLDLTMPFGDSATFRKAFIVPVNVALKSLILQDAGSRPVVIDLAGFTAK